MLRGKLRDKEDRASSVWFAILPRQWLSVVPSVYAEVGVFEIPNKVTVAGEQPSSLGLRQTACLILNQLLAEPGPERVEEDEGENVDLTGTGYGYVRTSGECILRPKEMILIIPLQWKEGPDWTYAQPLFSFSPGSSTQSTELYIQKPKSYQVSAPSSYVSLSMLILPSFKFRTRATGSTGCSMWMTV